MSDLVLYEVKPGGVAVLTLNRADRRNALSRALITAIGRAFERAADDVAVRSVILAAAGPVFCAGMDLAELRASLGAGLTEAPVWDDALHLAQLYDRIYTLPKPTIAAVNGAAVAGGAGLVSVCDLAVCAPEAKFGYPEVRRGLVAAMVMPHLISADEAMAAGFVNEVVPSVALLDQATSYARQIAEGGPEALARTKELLHRFSRQVVSIEEAARASAAPRLTAECKQGLEAYFAKRPAPWAPHG
jgi:methylglutaconyl-CoA hydratase